MCEEITYSNSSGLAVLFAEAAADTSYLAYVHQRFSFFVRITLNESLLFVWNQLDQMFRADSYAFAAGLAGFFVYNRDAVYEMYRVKRTGIYT